MEIRIKSDNISEKELIKWAEKNCEFLMYCDISADEKTAEILEKIKVNMTEYDECLDTEYIRQMNLFKGKVKKL